MENNGIKISNKLNQKCTSETLKAKKIQDIVHNQVNSVKEKNKIDIMALNLKLLLIGGLHPLEKTNNTRWRLRLYHTYNIVLHLLYLPTLLLQIYTLYYDLGDLDLTIDNICTIVIVLVAFLPPLNLNWNTAYDIIYRMQTNSIFTKLSTQKDSKKMRLLLETQQKSWIITVFGCVFVSIIVLVVYFEPFIINLFNQNVLSDNLNSTLSFGKDYTRFPFNIQSPFDTSFTITYLALYVVIFIGFIVVLIKISVPLTFLFSLMMFILTQFKIVVTSIENIDNMVEANLKVSSNSDKQKSTMQLDYADSSLESKDIDDFEINREDISLIDDYPGVDLLVESIKEHQDVIAFLKDANNYFKSGFFAYQNLAAIIFTLTLFQLAEYKEANVFSSTKCTLIIAFILFQGGTFCWLADNVRTQGLTIGEAAYKLKWYRRSKKFNMLLKMIILRGQIPNYILVGEIHKMTLEHLSAVVNSAYSVFTLLLQFKKN